MKDILFDCFERISERTMTSFESENAVIIEKFNGGKSNLWKSKFKLLLASMDLWDILDISKEHLPSNVDPKVLKEYQRHVTKAMSNINLNLADNQCAYIKSCKRFAEA